MNLSKLPIRLAVFCCLSMSAAYAQNFSSGSDGSLGALNVTSNTVVNLPPDGRLHYTTVNVAPNTVLSFRRNALNTPVYLLATGNVVVEGTIDVSGATATAAPTGGLAGPGGFDGGKPGFGAELPPGDGYGPGGGRGGLNDFSPEGAGAGSFGSLPIWSQSANNHGTNLYGGILLPMIGGSGGGGSAGSPGVGGGGGGGALLIASSTSISISGRLNANGGGRASTPVNAGSGGAIRLIAPIVRGAGIVDVRGNFGDGSAGHGRIRVDALDRKELLLNFNPREMTTVGGNMLVFPPTVPRLDIVEAAGTTIPVGAPNPVTIQLPFGSDNNRTVTVQASDFAAKVPIEVVLTPESGDRIVLAAEIDNTAQNPARLAVPVTIPRNVLVTVNVWTK